MKKYRLYCVLNDVPKDKIEGSLSMFNNWVLNQFNGNILVEWNIKEVKEEVSYLSADYLVNGKYVKYSFLDHSIIRKFNKEAVGFHAVVYFYDPLKHNDPGGVINGTSVVDGRVQIQVVARNDYNVEAIFRELKHENIHGFFANLRLKGIFLNDLLDTHANEEGEELEMAKIRPYWSKLCDNLPVDVPVLNALESKIKSMINAVSSLASKLKLVSNKVSVEKLAQAMAEFEGFYIIGTRANRNNNPLNVKYVGQALAIGKDDKNFCIFKTPEDGWTTGIALLRIKIFDQFFNKTISDVIKNWTSGDSTEVQENYINFVCQKLGITPDYPCYNFTY